MIASYRRNQSDCVDLENASSCQIGDKRFLPSFITRIHDGAATVETH